MFHVVYITVEKYPVSQSINIAATYLSRRPAIIHAIDENCSIIDTKDFIGIKNYDSFTTYIPSVDRWNKMSDDELDTILKKQVEKCGNNYTETYYPSPHDFYTVATSSGPLITYTRDASMKERLDSQHCYPPFQHYKLVME